ncbi:hypothetical protein Tco_1357412 [Tanacetum coccineum]
MNKFKALKTTIQHLSNHDFPMNFAFTRAFHQLFETLQKKDSKSTVKVINAQFQKFIHSEVLKSSNYDSDSREVRKDFKQYTHMEVQSFKDLIIQHMDSIDQYSRVQVQEVKASDASSGDKDISGIVSDSGNDQSLENQSNTSGDEISKSMDECNDKSTSGDDTDTRRPSYDT